MKTNKLIEKTKGYFTKSFTLIELIVVIVVIGILSAIVVPNISSFKDEAKETAMLSDGKNLQTAVDMYQLDNHGDFPVLSEEGAESKNPTLGDPKAIDFAALYPEYIRDLPQHSGMYYWIDYQGQVYLSTIDNPDDFNQDADGLSWTANDQAAGYEVYEVENSNTSASKGALLKTVGKLKGQIDSLSPVGYTSEKTYLISVVDSYGNIAAPVKDSYTGVAPYKPKSSVDPLTPEQEELINNPTNLLVVAGGNHSMVVDEEGSLWSFGRNTYGQLGHADYVGHTNPNVEPRKIMTDVKSVVVSEYHTLVIKNNGELWSFGQNYYGQLGSSVNNGTYAANPTPLQIMTNVKTVATGSTHTLVIKENGELWSFGLNQYGQLGHSTNTGNNNPNPNPKLIMPNVKSVTAGVNHSLVLNENEELFSFGRNQYGQLGYATNSGTNTPNPSPTKIMSNVKGVSAGNYHTIILNSTDELWSLGHNYFGELGRANNSGTTQPNPTPELMMTDIKSFTTGNYQTFAIKKNGELFSAGRNYYGELGHSANVGGNTPNPNLTRVLVNVLSISSGSTHTIALKKDGELYSFGNNKFWQLGRSDNNNTDNPNPIPTQFYLPIK